MNYRIFQFKLVKAFLITFKTFSRLKRICFFQFKNQKSSINFPFQRSMSCYYYTKTFYKGKWQDQGREEAPGFIDLSGAVCILIYVADFSN